MPDFNEETYSAIFTSLKHPVRRKILRTLAKKKLTFSEILEILKIDSGHLSYHLEGLEDLISKNNKGKYKLTYLGEAAVTTMSKVEKGPFTEKWKPNILKPIILVFLLLVGLVYVQSLHSEIDELNQTNELLWSQYFSLIEPSKHSPPMSEREAIQKAIEYGNWNSTSLKGLAVNATLLCSKFEEHDNSNRTLLFPGSYPVTDNEIIDYSPFIEGDFPYRYTWVVTINPIQNPKLGYLSGLVRAANGYYFFDAYTREIYPHLSSPLYIDSEV